jgi:hypothetical protein
MLALQHWLHAVADLLQVGDVGTVGTLITAVGGSLVATVTLVEADVTVEEALSYAGVLYDLGQRAEAVEIAQEAVTEALRVVTPDALA